MAFDTDSGYEPQDFNDFVGILADSVNEQFGESYTPQSIVGTDWYKTGYAGIQIAMNVENRISQAMAKVSDYLVYYNKELSEPRTTPTGIMQNMEKDLGVVCSVMPVETVGQAGHVNICCDVSGEDAELKEKIINFIGANTCAGSYFGDEVNTEQGVFVGLNGQQFQVGYSLPTEVDIDVKVTVTVSRNTTDFIPIENQIVTLFKEKFAAAYRLGYDFEPDAYLCKDDMPFAADIKVEWGTDGTVSNTGVLKLAYNQKAILNNVSAVIVDE